MSSAHPEKIIYQKGDISVTRSLLKYKNIQYHIRDIYSLKRVEQKPDTEPLDRILTVGVMVAIVSFLSRSLLGIAIGVIIIAFAIYQLNQLKSTYTLIVTTNKGDEINITTGNNNELNDIHFAIETAIDMLAYGT
ncbi:DUF6232 family protein [Aerosakkonema funiforme]|uniref:QacE n=2 Tax=Oscillatoriophycideae TaxID=1301283 RepID=A0A926ZL40_9CYAN|nr:DUF6232 family protein [Aerosakkonema funiforme]MBD2184686.1 hypothetical protein [Aerosakkonema funiforme FACHB-1375]